MNSFLKKFLTLLLVIENIFFVIPAIASESTRPSIVPRINASTQDASNESVSIDIYYEVNSSIDIDESKLPETFLRLPGYEEATALRSKPYLISGNLKQGSWLARFSYPKGIRPGIYVASISEWFDMLGNQSSTIIDVKVRIDNINFGEVLNETPKPTSIKCGTGQETSDQENSNADLFGYILCVYNSNSLKNQIKISLNLKNTPQGSSIPEIVKLNEEVYSPKTTGTQKANFRFKITPTQNGSYVFGAKIEFLGFSYLTQNFEVVLRTPIITNPATPKSAADEYSFLANSEVTAWNEKLKAYALSRNTAICFELPKWLIPSFTEDIAKNREVLKNFRESLYGQIFAITQQKIDNCSTQIDQSYFLNQAKIIADSYPIRLLEKLKFTNKCIGYIASKNPLPVSPSFTQVESENRSLLEVYKKSIDEHLEKVVTQSRFKFDPLCIPTMTYYKSVNEGVFLEFRNLLLEKFPKACPQLLFPTPDPGYTFVQEAYVKGGPEAAELRVGFYRRVLETRFENIAAEIDQKCQNVSFNSNPMIQKTTTTKATPSSKKSTITCIKGKLRKTVTGIKPSCPKGFTRK